MKQFSYNNCFGLNTIYYIYCGENTQPGNETTLWGHTAHQANSLIKKYRGYKEHTGSI